MVDYGNEGDSFGDYFMGTGLVKRMFNVLFYGCFNEVAALFWIKNCHMFLKKMYCSSMGKSCVITKNLLFNFDGLK